MLRSWYVLLTTTGSMPLLGGVFSHRSVRCGTKEMAVNLMETLLAGQPPEAKGCLVKSGKLPEIILHCGEFPQVIGFPCPGCRKVLTVEDAKESAKHCT